MLWSFVTMALFGLIAAWIVDGFLGGGLSLALTFMPLFLVTALVAVPRALARPGGVHLGRTERSFALLAGLLPLSVLISWSFSAVDTTVPLDVRLFNLLVPLSVSLLPLLVWILPISQREYRRVVRVFAFVLVLDVLVSAATVLFVNLTRLVPPELFALNQNYTVLYFPLEEGLWVRTPGVFESGGTNGSFLLLAYTLGLAAALWGRGRHRVLLGAGLVLCAALIVLTLARRNILALVCVSLVLAIAGLTIRGKLLPLAGSLLLIVALPLLAALLAPTVLGSESLISRVAFWRVNLETVAGDAWFRPLTGYGLMQSSFRFLPVRHLALIDNAYLGLFLYGGPLHLVSYLAYYGALLAWSLRVASRPDEKVGWLAVANAALIIGMLVIGGFSVFVHNLTEAFPYLLAVNLLARYVAAPVEPAGVIQ